MTPAASTADDMRHVCPALTAPPGSRASCDDIALRREEPGRNMARFYTLSVEVTLFDDWSCTRRFGRIGARGGRLMIGLYRSEAEARDAFARLLAAKRRRGYAERPPARSG
jgi:predicted DNA-binding WGR domain protein